MAVREALLALLAEGSKYGLQLRQDFEARTGEVWPLNVGQVYSTLQRLERDGRVESEGDDGPQNRYRITEAGRVELEEWLRPPGTGAGPPRDELVVKILVAIGVPGIDMFQVVQEHRRWVLEEMQAYTRLKEHADPGELGFLVVADAEIFRLDATARWLDAVEGRLRIAGANAIDFTPAPRSSLASRRRWVGAER